VRVERNAARVARDDDRTRVLRARARRRAMSIADASRSASLCAALGHGFGSLSVDCLTVSRARAHRRAPVPERTARVPPSSIDSHRVAIRTWRTRARRPRKIRKPKKAS